MVSARVPSGFKRTIRYMFYIMRRRCHFNTNAICLVRSESKSQLCYWLFKSSGVWRFVDVFMDGIDFVVRSKIHTHLLQEYWAQNAQNHEANKKMEIWLNDVQYISGDLNIHLPILDCSVCQRFLLREISKILGWTSVGKWTKKTSDEIVTITWILKICPM